MNLDSMESVWRAMSEKQFQAQVESLARDYGWKHYHTYRSVHSAPGFPDLVCARGDRLLFLELKTMKGRVSPAQQGWQDALRQVPCAEVFVLRPSDIDRIHEALR